MTGALSQRLKHFFSCFVIFLLSVLLPTLHSVEKNPKKPAKPAMSAPTIVLIPLKETPMALVDKYSSSHSACCVTPESNFLSFATSVVSNVILTNHLQHEFIWYIYWINRRCAWLKALAVKQSLTQRACA